MKALLTSFNRPDLLMQTLNSLLQDQPYPLGIQVYEDSPTIDYSPESLQDAFGIACVSVKKTGGIGQHQSITRFLEQNEGKHYLHLEDDWEFNNTYDWITASLSLMDQDESVIKVLARADSPHPCVHNYSLQSDRTRMFGYLDPWLNDGILWHGFSWNAGVTRMDYLKRFMPFPKFEQDLAERIWKAGYKVAELKDKVYTHIGGGRSTVHLDPSK
jgi:GT2 family glycosyltransferase